MKAKIKKIKLAMKLYTKNLPYDGTPLFIGQSTQDLITAQKHLDRLHNDWFYCRITTEEINEILDNCLRFPVKEVIYQLCCLSDAVS